MKIILFIVLVMLLVGCSEFETMMEDRRMMTCSPSYETLCAGWQI